MEKEYKYDVAISFAEEDRNAALALALALEMENIRKVYYYPLLYEVTWGADLGKKLEAVYAEEARYAVVLISRNYFKKRLAQVELRAIKKRLLSEKKVIYMLPVLLDESAINEAADLLQLGYVKWEFNPRKIADLLNTILGDNIQKLGHISELPGMDVTFFHSNTVLQNDVSINQTGGASTTSRSRINVVENNKFLGEGKFILNEKNK